MVVYKKECDCVCWMVEGRLQMNLLGLIGAALTAFAAAVAAGAPAVRSGRSLTRVTSKVGRRFRPEHLCSPAPQFMDQCIYSDSVATIYRPRELCSSIVCHHQLQHTTAQHRTGQHAWRTASPLFYDAQPHF